MQRLTPADVQDDYLCRVAYEAWCEQQTLDSTPELRNLKARHDRARVAEWRERMWVRHGAFTPPKPAE